MIDANAIYRLRYISTLTRVEKKFHTGKIDESEHSLIIAPSRFETRKGNLNIMAQAQNTWKRLTIPASSSPSPMNTQKGPHPPPFACDLGCCCSQTVLVLYTYPNVVQSEGLYNFLFTLDIKIGCNLLCRSTARRSTLRAYL